LEGSCAEGDAPCALGSGLMQKHASRGRQLAAEEAELIAPPSPGEEARGGAGAGVGKTGASMAQATSKKQSGWPKCQPLSVGKINVLIKKEQALLKVREKKSKKCVKGVGNLLGSLQAKINYVRKCLRIRFKTKGMFLEAGAEDGAAESKAESTGAGGLAEAEVLTDAEAEAAKNRNWPNWSKMTEKEGIQTILDTGLEIEKWEKFQKTKCVGGVYWTKKKIAYLEKCKKSKR